MPLMPYCASSISVFFPAFNDERTIATMVTNAVAVLQTLTTDYEVLVINDGSTDGTAGVLNSLVSTIPRLKVIHHPHNKGYGAALCSGFSNATKDLIFYTDGDGQYDARELAQLLPLMSSSVDVVNGYKIKRADRRRRIVLGAIYNQLAGILFRLPIQDVDCDFRLIRRRAIGRITLTLSSGAVCVELVRKLSAAGCTFAETPVHHYPRLHGHSQFFALRPVFGTAVDFLNLWLKLVLLPRFTRSRCQNVVSEDGPVSEVTHAQLK